MSERCFIVLSRPWCHLCDDFTAALAPLANELGWRITVLDIDEHPQYLLQWDEKVPVLLVDDVQLCHYHLDESKVRAYCANFPLESGV